MLNDITQFDKEREILKFDLEIMKLMQYIFDNDTKFEYHLQEKRNKIFTHTVAGY